jgi:hypothetical protein
MRAVPVRRNRAREVGRRSVGAQCGDLLPMRPFYRLDRTGRSLVGSGLCPLRQVPHESMVACRLARRTRRRQAQ